MLCAVAVSRGQLIYSEARVITDALKLTDGRCNLTPGEKNEIKKAVRVFLAKRKSAPSSTASTTYAMPRSPAPVHRGRRSGMR